MQNPSFNFEQSAGEIFAFLPCCCMSIVFVGLFVLWLWALIDCLMRDFRGNDKIVWILVILLLNWLGAIIYLLFGRRSSPPPGRP